MNGFTSRWPDITPNLTYKNLLSILRQIGRADVALTLEAAYDPKGDPPSFWKIETILRQAEWKLTNGK